MAKDGGRVANDDTCLNSKQVKRRQVVGTVSSSWMRFLSRSGRMEFLFISFNVNFYLIDMDILKFIDSSLRSPALMSSEY